MTILAVYSILLHDSRDSSSSPLFPSINTLHRNQITPLPSHHSKIPFPKKRLESHNGTINNGDRRGACQRWGGIWWRRQLSSGAGAPDSTDNRWPVSTRLDLSNVVDWPLLLRSHVVSQPVLRVSYWASHCHSNHCSGSCLNFSNLLLWNLGFLFLARSLFSSCVVNYFLKFREICYLALLSQLGCSFFFLLLYNSFQLVFVLVVCILTKDPLNRRHIAAFDTLKATPHPTVPH